MSAIHKKSGPRRVAVAAAGVFFIAGFGLSFSERSAQAAAPLYSDVMPLSQVKPGMTGYGLTTFKGTTISRFDVKVIGILRKVNNGHDLILIRMKGGPITERGANLIQGMSGSPIYLDGKCIGAFSQGETWPKEPVGMVTPIEDMLEAWDPAIPQNPPYFQPAEKPTVPTPSPTDTKARSPRPLTLGKPDRWKPDKWKPDNSERGITLSQPITVGSRRITHLVLNAHPHTKFVGGSDVAVMHRATTYAVVGGVTEKERAWFQKELDKRGYAFTVAQTPVMGAGKANIPATPLRPGSCFGTFLSSGDVEFGAFGTVTYRRDNRILGFGHPFFGFGALNASATTASVVDVFSGVQVSHLIAEAGPVVGTITQDRNFSVSVELGRKPIQIPFDITVRDETTHRNQTFHSLMFQHPELTSALMSLIGKAAVSRVHNTPGDVMAKVTTTVEAGEVGKITRTNLLFDADDISVPAVQDLNEITSIVSGNPFYPLPIKRASMTIDLFSGHNTATVERIFLKQGRYEPGDTLEVGVVLKPYRRESVIKYLSLKVPADTPSNRYALTVRGGTASMMRIGAFSLGGAADSQTPPANVRQMIARLTSHEKSTDLVARLVLNTGAPALEGEKLSQLPPNLAVLMRSDRNSGVRIERDEVRTTAPADYIVSGTQQLYVTIQRKNTQEATGATSIGGSSSGSPSVNTSLPAAGGALSLGSSTLDDDEKEEPGLSNSSLFLSAGPQNWLSILNQNKNKKQNYNYANNRKDFTAENPVSVNSSPETNDLGSETMVQAGAAGVRVAPAASAVESDNARVVGRQLHVWRQSGTNGFASGKFVGTSVTAAGELRLAPRLRRLATTNETYVWSIVADAAGSLYAGTGTAGKILKIDPAGKVTTFAQIPGVAVQSLLLARDGTLWAGSSAQGQLFHITREGTVTHIATLPAKYILALCEDSKGAIYIGSGSGGQIYKVPAGYLPRDADRTDSLPIFVKTGGEYITAMTIDAQDRLYVGTGNEGIVYKIQPDGKSSVLYDAKENSITALTLDKSGALYAGTGPKGLLYRIAPDGTATVVYDRATSFYTGLRLATDGTLYATTVNTAYHIFPSTNAAAPAVVQPLDNPRDVDFLTLALLPNNGIVIGTGNIGEVYTSQPQIATSSETGANGAVSGTFESVVHDCKILSRWGTLRWNASLPSDSRLVVETRTGSAAEPDATWSDWQPVIRDSSEGRIVSPPARFIQYRLSLRAQIDTGVPVSAAGGLASSEIASSELASTQRMPAVREISLSYLPRNQAPRVAFTSLQGGERLSKTQTTRWSGSDPDGDTLSYTLYYSTDGINWKLLPPAGLSAGRPPAPAATSGATPAPTLEDTQKRLEAQTNAPEPIKRMILESAQRRKEEAKEGASTGETTTGSQRETSRTWDTHALPDGTYWLKVVASDIASNPTDPQTAQAISEPFVVVNAVPVLTLSGMPIIGAERRVTLTGSATQALVPIIAVQYRLDGGEWLAAAPKDGLFDSQRESFSLVTAPLAPGKHTLEVAAFNAANNKTVQSVEVTIP